MKGILFALFFFPLAQAHAQNLNCTSTDGNDWQISGEVGGPELVLSEGGSSIRFALKFVPPPVYIYQDGRGGIIELQANNRRVSATYYMEGDDPTGGVRFACVLN